MSANVSSLKVLLIVIFIFLLAAMIINGYIIANYLKMISQNTSRMNIDIDDVADKVIAIISSRYELKPKN